MLGLGAASPIDLATIWVMVEVRAYLLAAGSVLSSIIAVPEQVSDLI
jgi:hypothetical protein